jgi:septal ring factor EnvC (AmiA/AmiB activator)
MSHATGTFQQKELREKIRRLEEEIARTRATAEEVSRRAQERLAGKDGSGPAAPIDEAASDKKPKA